MNAKQFDEALDTLGVKTRPEAAALLGVTKRTVNGYVAGAKIPILVERFLHLMITTRTPLSKYI